MRRAAGACAAVLLAASLSAHGGMYVPPPDPRGFPGPGAPTTGGPMPAQPTYGPGPMTPAGLGVDQTRWELWWEVHRLAYLDVKRAVHKDEGGPDPKDTNSKRVTRPGKAELLAIVELLKRTLDESTSKDVSSSCLVALAKIGIDGDTFKLVDVLRKELQDNEQELRETAALALGISQRKEALPLLQHLVGDDQEGRHLVGRGTVDDRVRSFAAYGLGLLAWASENVADKEQVLKTVRAVLEDKDLVSRNLKVAALQATRLLRCDPAATPAHKRLLWSALAMLEKYFLADLGRGTQLVQAHVPTAVARLLEDVPGDDRERWNKLFLEELTAPKRRDATITQSCAIALGFMAMPPEGKPADAELSKTLRAIAKKHQDVQTRHYAAISLGRIRGDQNRADLLASFASAKQLERPWLALALAVLQHEVEKADAQIQAALVGGLEGENEPGTVAGLAIACGLARAANAAPTLRSALLRFKHQDATIGHLCVALGLIDDKASQPVLEQLLQTATRRPEVIRGAALGLARVAGPAASDVLVSVLESGDTSTARLAGIAQALELIGDRRAIKSLTAIVQKQSSTNMARAFAIAALGGIADKEELPWGVKIAFGVNYTAPVETLIDGSSGILDIL